MANADKKRRSAGWAFGDAHVHSGSGAELVGAFPLRSGFSHYSLLVLVSSASSSIGDSGQRAKCFGFAINATASSTWSIHPLGLIDDWSVDIGSMTATWTYAISSGEFRLSCAAASGIVSRVTFFGHGLERSVS